MASLIDKYTKEELEEIIKQSSSLTEFIKNIGYDSISSNTYKIVRQKLDFFNIPYSRIKQNDDKISRTPENIFIKNSTASQATVRRWYIKGNDSEYKCSICGQEPIWQGKDLTLILDHIDGDNHNSVLENLRWVCPNCNQQLPTTGFKKMRTPENPKEFFSTCIDCGKKIGYRSLRCTECSKIHKKELTQKVNISKEDLKEKIKNKSFISISKELDVSTSTIKRWCKKYNLPDKKSEIQKYTDEEWDKI